MATAKAAEAVSSSKKVVRKKKVEIDSIEVPDTIVKRASANSISDYVKANKKAYDNAACYSTVMQSLQKSDFDLYPKKGQKSVLPKAVYERWMALCQQHGMLPMNATWETKAGKNYCHFSGKKQNRHITYAGLCCYRWTENQPILPYMAVHVYESTPFISFFQAFHYAQAKYLHFTNHNFTSITKGLAYSAAGASIISTNLLLGLGIKLLFMPTATGKTSANLAIHKTGTTISRIDAMVRKLGFTTPEMCFDYQDVKGIYYYNTKESDLKKLREVGLKKKLMHVPELKDLLWSDWAKIYVQKRITKAWLLEYYDEVMKARGLK